MIFLPSTNWISGDRWKRLLLTKLLIDLNDRFLVSDELACLYLVLNWRLQGVTSTFQLWYFLWNPLKNSFGPMASVLSRALERNLINSLSIIYKALLSHCCLFPQQNHILPLQYPTIINVLQLSNFMGQNKIWTCLSQLGCMSCIRIFSLSLLFPSL